MLSQQIDLLNVFMFLDNFVLRQDIQISYQLIDIRNYVRIAEEDYTYRTTRIR